MAEPEEKSSSFSGLIETRKMKDTLRKAGDAVRKTGTNAVKTSTGVVKSVGNTSVVAPTKKAHGAITTALRKRRNNSNNNNRSQQQPQQRSTRSDHSSQDNQVQRTYAEGSYDSCSEGPEKNEALPVASAVFLKDRERSNAVPVVLTPTTEFWTRNTSIYAIASVVLALYPSWTYVRDNRYHLGDVPLPTVASWLLVVFCLGRVLEHSNGGDWDSTKPPVMQRTSIVATSPNAAARIAPIGKRHSILSSLYRFQNKNLNVLLKQPPRIFSALRRHDDQKLSWDWSVDPTKFPIKMKSSNALLNFLETHKYTRSHSGSRRQSATGIPPPVPDGKASLGSFDISSRAGSIQVPDVEPLFTLRGMDVFLTDEAETELNSHPWLIQQGLRDVPTFVTNVLTMWGNILLYFEMPAWIKNFTTCLEDQEGDDEQIASLKRFLRGSDDYRNKRLNMIPSVVEAPVCVMMVAPPKKECPVHNPSFLPVGWKFTDREVVGRGRTLQPIVECELNCLASRAMRGMAGLVKRNLKNLVIDVAVVIRPPLNSTKGKDLTIDEGEALCCLGMWRFDHVDTCGCPDFPDRDAAEFRDKGVDLDEIRASRLSKKFSAMLSE